MSLYRPLIDLCKNCLETCTPEVEGSRECIDNVFGWIVPDYVWGGCTSTHPQAPISLCPVYLHHTWNYPPSTFGWFNNYKVILHYCLIHISLTPNQFAYPFTYLLEFWVLPSVLVLDIIIHLLVWILQLFSLILF